MSRIDPKISELEFAYWQKCFIVEVGSGPIYLSSVGHFIHFPYIFHEVLKDTSLKVKYLSIFWGICILYYNL